MSPFRDHCGRRERSGAAGSPFAALISGICFRAASAASTYGDSSAKNPHGGVSRLLGGGRSKGEAIANHRVQMGGMASR